MTSHAFSKRYVFRFLLIVLLLASASLSCKLVLNPGDVIEGLVSTQFEAVVTDIDIEGLVTEVDMGGIATEMEAMMTDMDLEPLVTEMGSIATEFGDFGALETVIPGGERPQDIPIMPGNPSMMTESSTLVMYSINAQLQAGIDFYEREMPVNGWTKVANEFEKGEDYATLVYTKDNRKARVELIVIPFLGDMTVTITIES